MTTIVTELGKFKYYHLPMSMCAFGDIFQAKVDKMPGNIEGFQSIYPWYISLNQGDILWERRTTEDNIW